MNRALKALTGATVFTGTTSTLFAIGYGLIRLCVYNPIIGVSAVVVFMWMVAFALHYFIPSE